MRQYTVSGMGCAACQASVEKAVREVEGVTEVAVSLLTNSMGVEGRADPRKVIEAVEKAGYGASIKGGSAEGSQQTARAEGETGGNLSAALEDHETPALKKRLITSVGFLIPLMYISMGHTMWGFPMPEFLMENHMALGIIQMVLAAIIMAINGKFFTGGFGSLLRGAPNMDTLVAMGSFASFAWSVVVLFTTGNMHNFYFEAAAMIVTLITVGKMLEAMSKGRTTSALKSLMNLAPQTATIIIDGKEKEVGIDEVKRGNLFVVRPGESIPVDGIILEGDSAVDESALSGESIPVDKTVGDVISAATINRSGFIQARATRVGEDTTLAQIIQMVSDAAATKAPIAKAADKVSGIFVPAVLFVALLTMVVWLIIGADFSYSLTRAVAVLVISCPCALGLATPVSIMVGNGVGAKNGILFKTAQALEIAGKSEIMVLDKTGTITKGEPELTDILPSEGIEEEELLALAAALEKRSEHPLAKAILTAAEARGMIIPEVSDFSAVPGKGLTAKVAHDAVAGDEKFLMAGGNLEFISEAVSVSHEMKKAAENLAQDGKTCLYFAKADRLLGLIAVADTIKEDSPEAIKRLKDMGFYVVMLTGDNRQTAQAMGEQAGVDEVIAQVKPEGKEAVIRELQRRGAARANGEDEANTRVVMVGDGINDAPALTKADTGIAIGAGTDVAIDAADVVLMNSRLSDVVTAIRLSRATVRNIHQNLFWAFIYNLILIPLAAGAYIGILGWTLNPMIAAAAMSISSFCVVMNSLRLNRFR
ncbi:MAG: heavy metal translocating P-type ATPase [Eubacteriales bacterium]|nr:heavy metal translocating P-type ATPase [Eubacteriales bacterium]